MVRRTLSPPPLQSFPAAVKKEGIRHQESSFIPVPSTAVRTRQHPNLLTLTCKKGMRFETGKPCYC